MTDPTTFETRLAEAFGRYADRMPVDVDAAAVVGWAAVDRVRARRGWLGTWLGPRLVPVVLGLLALAALAGAIVAGSLVLRSEPISIAPPSIAPSGLTPVALSGPIHVAETGAMLTPRTGHAAVRLLDGRVLIVGGTSTRPVGAPGPGHRPMADGVAGERGTVGSDDGPVLRDGSDDDGRARTRRRRCSTTVGS